MLQLGGLKDLARSLKVPKLGSFADSAWHHDFEHDRFVVMVQENLPQS